MTKIRNKSQAPNLKQISSSKDQCLTATRSRVGRNKLRAAPASDYVPLRTAGTALPLVPAYFSKLSKSEMAQYFIAGSHCNEMRPEFKMQKWPPREQGVRWSGEWERRNSEFRMSPFYRRRGDTNLKHQIPSRHPKRAAPSFSVLRGYTARLHASPCGSCARPKRKCRTRRGSIVVDFDDACSSSGRMTRTPPFRTTHVVSEWFLRVCSI